MRRIAVSIVGLVCLLACLLLVSSHTSAQAPKSSWTPINGGAAGGGVIGTAVFSASGGSIASLSVSGVISGVTRLGAGSYEVSFSAAQSNYTVALAASDNNSATVLAYLSGDSFSTIQTSATSFSFFTFYQGGTQSPGDPAVVTVTVFQVGGG
jgi:hypothetical protein